MTEKQVPWEQITLKGFTSDDLAKALRERGLVTADDIRCKQKVALGVLQALYKVDLAALNAFAFTERKPVKAARPAFAEKEVKDG